MSEKLQKVLADLGHGSRRRMETAISDGRVTVNGEVAHLGQRVGPEDNIAIDGQRPSRPVNEPARVLVMNKSTGVICSRRDSEGRATVFENLPKLRKGRWISIGRLDVMTSGLLLFTNDGDLAARMMHPSTGLDREYAVRVDTALDDDVVEQLKRGVVVEDEPLGFSDLRFYAGKGRNHWYHAVLMEGKNREVRRLFEAVGSHVNRLKRVRYGPVALPSWLRVGHLAELSTEDMVGLYTLLKLPMVPGSRRPLARKDKSTLLLPYPELPALADLPTPRISMKPASGGVRTARGAGRHNDMRGRSQRKLARERAAEGESVWGEQEASSDERPRRRSTRSGPDRRTASTGDSPRPRRGGSAGRKPAGRGTGPRKGPSKPRGKS